MSDSNRSVPVVIEPWTFESKVATNAGLTFFEVGEGEFTSPRRLM